MKERGIIFSAPMVRALLDGRKTVTRRIVNLDDLAVTLPREVRSDLHPAMSQLVAPPGRHPARMNPHGAVSIVTREGELLGVRPGEFDFVCPFADGPTHLGDYGGGRKRWTITPRDSRLWVRESWATRLDRDHLKPSELDPKWDHPSFWADPNTMNTGCGGAAGKVRSPIYLPRWASRLTLEVTGVRVERLNEISEEDAIAEGMPAGHEPKGTRGPRALFAFGWDTLHGDGAWDLNPFVWAITFRRVEEVKRAA